MMSWFIIYKKFIINHYNNKLNVFSFSNSFIKSILIRNTGPVGYIYLLQKFLQIIVWFNIVKVSVDK